MSVSGAISFLRLSFFPVEVGKLFPCMIIFNLLFQDLLQQESWYSPIIFVVRFVFLKPPDCYSGFAANWIFFHAVRHHSAELSATTFRQRSMFPVFYTRRHLFCRHSSLQHWSVRLALEWMTCFSWKTHRIWVGRPFALDLFLYDCCRPVRC